ncbi:DNA repair protein RecN [Christensenellaceae bacterium OttesenSCG-928-L17]|nr:DNA repair protein RecN [Christensenellaceae bacterium OttesenSCG-928-L17]
MLQTIRIQNIALIDELEITFSYGLHVLTGETGAGKSIIIDAVNFVLGARASRDLIKSQREKASVQASFFVQNLPALSAYLHELGIDMEGGELIVSRELTIHGKNTCRINGTLVTLAALKEVAMHLINIHGQHEHQTLLQPDDHIAYLDAFGKDTIAPLIEETANLYHALADAKKALLVGFGSEEERLRRIDMLAYQVREINEAQLQPGEEEALDAELKLLSNAMQIISALDFAHNTLADEESGVLHKTFDAVRQMDGIHTYHADYEAVFSRLEDAYYALEDVGYTLRDLRAGFEFDPARLEEIEARIRLLHELERKYGSDIPAILAYLETAQAEYDTLLESDRHRAALEKECDELLARYRAAADTLTTARKDAAKRLCTALVEQLKDLGMKNAQFEVAFRPLESFSENGMDYVEFLFSTNAGEPVKPLHKVASGGELSRIMLGFKTINIGSVPTVIFDEIDSGISGNTAVIVGKKLKQISATHQTLCITHLAQIAAMADTHYLVEKTEVDTRTVSSIRELNDEERVLELAHMMSGNADDPSAQAHARQLLHHLNTSK